MITLKIYIDEETLIKITNYNQSMFKFKGYLPFKHDIPENANYEIYVPVKQCTIYSDAVYVNKEK